MARRARPVEAGRRGRPALRARRCRRRLRRVRLAPGDRGGAGERPQPHPLRRADRGERGERQPRPARLPRGAGRPHRITEPGAVPRLGLPRLRAAVGDDVAARPGRRHAARRDPDRGRALRRGQRRRAVVVPHLPRAARPRRGQLRRRGCCCPSCTSRSHRIDAHRRATTAAEFPIGGHFPFVDGAEPMVDDHTEQLLARTWHPTLSITGVDGIPPVESAGNVLRPFTSLQLSFRTPADVRSRRPRWLRSPTR